MVVDIAAFAGIGKPVGDLLQMQGPSSVHEARKEGRSATASDGNIARSQRCVPSNFQADSTTVRLNPASRQPRSRQSCAITHGSNLDSSYSLDQHATCLRHLIWLLGCSADSRAVESLHELIGGIVL